MRPLFADLAIVSVLLSIGFSPPAPASDNLGVPTPASIETLLRERLAEDDTSMPSLIPYKNAVLMEFGLVVLDWVSSSRWHAEIDLLFDFGPPPPSILGFERQRRGRCRPRNLLPRIYGTGSIVFGRVLFPAARKN